VEIILRPMAIMPPQVELLRLAFNSMTHCPPPPYTIAYAQFPGLCLSKRSVQTTIFSALASAFLEVSA
jgi:hypothetical protein